MISHLTIKDYATKILNAIILLMLLFFTSGLMISNHQFRNDTQHFNKLQGSFAMGIITKPLEERNKSYRTSIEVTQVIDSINHIHFSDGNLLVYIQKDSTLSALEIGDEVIFHLYFKSVDAPKNPGQFDYKNYLQYKSIYDQQYISVNQIVIHKKHAALFVKRVSNNIAVYVQSILKRFIPGKQNFSLADGILLGHRADIDMELYNDFAYTGILHILSVSGLHVGIIYGMLLFFLSFIKDKNRKIKIAKFIFIFLFIWLFAFVTGFSAACVRAAILFSLLNYGKLSKEHVSNLNLLSGAALLQLLIDPNNLFDIGFQLSYLAMLGLFIFYKPIYAGFYHPNKLVDWTWQLWSASIAAQLFTVPLSIYYFGNFPTYFLFANIFAIPMSTVILWLGIALIPFSFIPFIGHIIGSLESLVIRLFIWFTYFFAELPLGKLFNLYISIEQLLLLLIAIVCLTFFIMQRQSKFLFACLGLFLITILISYYYSIQQVRRNEIVFYSIPKNLSIAINTNDQQLILSKDSLSETAFNFSVKNSYRKFRIRDHNQLLYKDSLYSASIYVNKNILYANGKCFYFLSKANSRKAYSPALQIDYLILSDNCYLDTMSLKTNFFYKHLILSSDNDNRHIKIYRRLLEQNGKTYTDLSEQALIINSEHI
ncbi:MAG: ComEC family competence protein [Bacteroidota bacterium]|nr:ComEC family competence protein [Bacteroidota bacterium]